MSSTLRGSFAVATGATGGIGRAVCQRLIGAGCRVIGTGATQREVGTAGADMSVAGLDWLVLDVTNRCPEAPTISKNYPGGRGSFRGKSVLTVSRPNGHVTRSAISSRSR